MLNTVDKVIKALGGTTSASEIVGCAPNAVSMWRTRGRIPPELFFLLQGALSDDDRLDPAVFGFKSARAKRRA